MSLGHHTADAVSSGPAPVDFAPAASSLRFEVADNLDRVAQAWRGFERTAALTLFQSYAYLSAWCRTAAAAQGETPLVLLAHDAAGLAFIWPLAVTRSGRQATLTWLGQAHGSLAFGLYRRDVPSRLGASDLRAAFAAIRAHRPDVVAASLEAQPLTLEGLANPLLRLPHTAYPVPLQVFDTHGSFESLLERTFDKRHQKELRRKTRILQELGGELTFAASAPERLEIQSAFIAQKARQLADAGESNVFAAPGIEAFYQALAASEDETVRPCYGAVRREGRIVATCVGFACGRRYYALQLAMDGGDLARAAPGQLLLAESVRRQCASGIETFDFGPGEGRHKSEWKCRAEPRFASYLALDPRGWPATLVRRTKERARQVVLETPSLHGAARRLRELRAPKAEAHQGDESQRSSGSVRQSS